MTDSRTRCRTSYMGTGPGPRSRGIGSGQPVPAGAGLCRRPGGRCAVEPGGATAAASWRQNFKPADLCCWCAPTGLAGGRGSEAVRTMRLLCVGQGPGPRSGRLATCGRRFCSRAGVGSRNPDRDAPVFARADISSFGPSATHPA